MKQLTALASGNPMEPWANDTPIATYPNLAQFIGLILGIRFEKLWGVFLMEMNDKRRVNSASAAIVQYRYL